MMRLNKCGSGELLGAERTIGSREDYWRQRGLLRTFSVLFPYSLITVHSMNCDSSYAWELMLGIDQFGPLEGAGTLSIGPPYKGGPVYQGGCDVLL